MDRCDRLAAAISAALALCAAGSATAGEKRSFRYEDGEPGTIAIGRYVGGGPGGVGPTSTPIACKGRTQEIRVQEVRRLVRVYSSFRTGDANPAPFEDGAPAGWQTVTVGQIAGGAFVPALRFGIVDDDRASPAGRASYVPGAHDGKIEYFGMYARPRTTYDFKIEIDATRGKAAVWVSGRGDDEWFPLATDAGTIAPVSAIDAVRVEQLPKAAGIDDLLIGSEVWPEGEQVRPHPLAKKPTAIEGTVSGFQRMRSIWREAARHVTVARRPNNPEGWWLGFPDVVLTGPGTLVANYVDGAGHGGFGRWWVTRSEDGGKTWKDIATIGRGGACMRIQKLRDGSLLMSEPAFFRSADGGTTWAQIGSMDARAAGGHGAGVASRVVEMDDGSWILAGSYTIGEPWKITEGETLEVYRSEDRGKTWKLHGTIKPPWPLSLSEPSIVPLPGGRLVLYARESGGFIPGVRTFSADGGKTWGPLVELPYRIGGRTCAALLADGRIFSAFRCHNGTPDTWGWAGSPDEPTRPLVHGIHINDQHSVSKKDGRELVIDGDGMRGQFTNYCFRPPDSDASRIAVTAEVKVLSNAGRAATISVPFVGKLRIFPDRAQLAGDAAAAVRVEPGAFHEYRIERDGAKVTVTVDGKAAPGPWAADPRVVPQAWTAHRMSPYAMEFGNEGAGDEEAPLDWAAGPAGRPIPDRKAPAATPPPLYLKNITPAVTGCSTWRRFEVRYDDPRTGTRTASWNGAAGGFPDQYQLDRILEIDATIGGADQGYPGWTQMDGGRILVLNYTDDTARWNRDSTGPQFGVSWIRATFLRPEELR